MMLTRQKMKGRALVVLRLVWVFVSNLYSIPAHLLMMTVLMPMKVHAAELYYYLDGVSFRWLQCLVAHWMYSADYKVAECGDDLRDLEDEETLLLVNHQSTSDVPALMYAMQFHGRVLDKVMWIMDVMFKYSNFGVISQLRGDFFIQQGKETRAMQGPLLQKHITDYYIPRNREWIIVFPEGGFFYKQKKSSQAFGKKKNLPHLEHCVLPRAGAVHAILQSLSPQAQPKDNPLDRREKTLKWMVDVTIAYPKGVPLDLSTIMMGHRAPMLTTIHYRKFPIAQVPAEQELLLQWLYGRYVEKDRMLEEFYKTGRFPSQEGTENSSIEPRVLEITAQRRFGLHLFYILLTYCQLYIICGIINTTWGVASYIL